MSDEVDMANEVAELYQASAVKLKKPVVEVKPRGKCLNCGTKIKGRRWCDATCRDDYEAEVGL